MKEDVAVGLVKNFCRYYSSSRNHRRIYKKIVKAQAELKRCGENPERVKDLYRAISALSFHQFSFVKKIFCN